jgi:hypothetical protein
MIKNKITKVNKEYKLLNNNTYDNVGVTISYDKPLKHHEMPTGYYIKLTCFNRTIVFDKYLNRTIATDEFAPYDNDHLPYILIAESKRFSEKKLNEIADQWILNIDKLNDLIKRNGRSYTITTDQPILVKKDQF